MRIRQLFFFILFFSACRTAPPPATSSAPKPKKNSPPVQQLYRASYTRVNDLVHTSLDIRPDWSRMQLDGKATLTLHPHFYPSDSVALNARGMLIHRVDLIKGRDTIAQSYDYDGSMIRFRLDKMYARTDTFKVFISYTSRPEELTIGGSAAIIEDKGLYFINPDGSDPHKPRQIWTQGETESNSVWFPTIEDPQQRMTQDVCIAVDTGFVTLSNGLLISSQRNSDGSHTDCWKQSLAAAPYLTMFAVGDFAVVHDHWRKLDVDYYVEHAYEQYARMTFGHTPEMMDFFSRVFGVDFVWEKYAQMVVREFVSGAMENTTAVVHREALQQTSREYLDINYEDYIAHELTHHWFGDLVTCESWSNIVLNEGFATYGEYLWKEFKFGRDEADHHFQRYQNIYLYSAGIMDADVIRFHYDNREDMYDAISYYKGGIILNMLRRTIGDEAFFAGLKEYLTAHKFSTVEVHDLREAFEKVTGQDLNWFFNEWFLDKGYPNLDISHVYDDSLRLQSIRIRQLQDFTKSPLYRMPIAVDVYCNGKAERHTIVLDKADQVFSFDVACKPDLVVVDAEKMLLCVKKEEKPRSQWVYQFYHAPLYMDRYEAVSHISDGMKRASEEETMLYDALADRYWNIRVLALKNIGQVASAGHPGLRAKLEKLALSDPESHVRASALKALVKNYDDDSTKVVLARAITDSSYLVVQTAFDQLAEKDKARARELAPSLERESSEDLVEAIAEFYTAEGRPEYNAFFRNSILDKKSDAQERVLDHYGNYLAGQEKPIRDDGILFLDSMARRAQPWTVRLSAYNALGDLRQELNKLVEYPKDSNRILTATDIESMRRQSDDIEAKQKSIRAGETNKKLLHQYNR